MPEPNGNKSISDMLQELQEITSLELLNGGNGEMDLIGGTLNGESFADLFS